MRKAYILRKLTGQVRSFAALMLITLLAVGNVFAEEVTYTYTFSEHYSATSPLGNGAINDVISFTTNKQSSSNDPAYNGNNHDARFYFASNGNGGCMTLTPGAGYKITGLTITANGNYTPAVGYSVDGGDPTVISVNAETKKYTISDVAATSSLKFYNANTTNTQLRILSITVTYQEAGDAPAVVVAPPTFSVATGTYYTPQTVALTAETGANIYYSINGEDPILYNAPFTVGETSTIVAYAEVGETHSANASVTLTFPVQIANIAAFYAGTNNTLYTITGDVQFVWRNGSNMYVQDPTGALLVYDEGGVITTEYNNGDIISGGLTGTFSPYNQLVEMKPTLNTAEGTPGVAVVPEEVSVADVLAHPENYMSKLVVLRGGTFAAGNFTVGSAKNVNYTQDGSTIQVRSQFKNIAATFTADEPATVIGFVGRYNNTIQLFPRSAADIIPLNATLPYSCDFDGFSSEAWTIVNDAFGANQWFIGTAQGFDNNKLYISSSNGLTNKYAVYVPTTIHAYVKVTLPASDVLLNFNCRSVGDANDFLQVSILDEAPEAGVLPETYLTRIYGMDEFDGVNLLIPASNAGEKYLVFTWNNDNNGGIQTPAAIDNLIMYTTCTAPTNIAATVDGRAATITWDASAGQSAWDVQYKDENSDVWQTVTANTSSVTLNDLSTMATYDVRVRTNCGSNGVSAWATSQFGVPCVDVTAAPADVTIGNGTTNTYNAPFGSYYKNSWIQMVYPASNFETPGYINSLSWEVNSANAQECSFLRIYIGTTTHENNTSTTDWLSMDDLTLVYEANDIAIGAAAGWETYTFNTPYYYNGEENLVVVTSRSSSAYKSLYYKSTGNNTNSVMYRWNDNDVSYASHPGSSVATNRNANLPNMVVSYADDCHDLHCDVPANLTVSDITTNSAVLSWEAGEATSWQVNYKAEDAVDWTTANVTENTYTLADLDQNTTYMVRVLADCGTIGMSQEAAVNFTTVASCLVPQNLSAEAITHTVNFSWDPVEGVNQYEVHVTGANNLDYTLNVLNATQTNITGLQENGQYTFAVRSLCDEENTSDWASIQFTMPTICTVPANFQVAEVGQTTAKLVWSPGFATAWTVEYGPQGFTLGEGTQVNVEETTALLTGLNPYTHYDAYVKADCGLGYESVWSSKVTFKTECGPILVTDRNPWIENFDSYTGSGNLAFDNCWATPEMSHYNSPFIYRNYSTTAHSGKNTVELKGDDGEVSTLVLPVFVNPLSDLQFSYYGMVTGTTPGIMQLGYITDVEDASTFVQVVEIPAQQGSFNRANSLLYGPYAFGDNVPAGARIALRFTSATNSCSWNLDDFTVEMLPDCQIPTDLTIASITASAATLSWTENGSATAWNIEYGPAGFEHGEGTVVAANANPFTVTGLDAAITYDFYVQASCGQDVTSEWSTKFTATTRCLPILVTDEYSWVDGFEAYESTGAFVCWETPVTYEASNGTFPLVYCNYAQGCHTGVNSAEFKGNTNMLVLPEFVNNIYDLQLSFWANRTSSSNGNLEVGYITDVTDATTFVPVATTPAPRTRPSSGTGATDMGIYLFPYNAPANARIALRYTNTSSSASWNVDDFTVSLAPICRASSHLTITDVTTTSANVSWTPEGLETAWVFQYKASNSDDWTTVNANTATVALSNLAYSTTYSLRVKPVCDDEDLAWLTGEFTTECNTLVPGIMDITIGEGTSTTNVAPMNSNYKNSWTQMVYPSSECGEEGDIYALSWYVNAVSAHTYSNLKIFLGTKSSAINESTSDWLPMEDLTLVYESENGTIGSQVGWETYQLSTPYHYNGEDNLVVVVSRAADNYKSVYYRYTSATNTVLYRRSDSNADYAQHPGSATGTRVTNLPNMTISRSGFVCGDEHCADPENFAVNDVTGTGATLTWDAGTATAWRVGYKTADAEEWTSVEVTNNTYELTGLDPITTYNVRVKTLCGGDESNYLTASFTTGMLPVTIPYFTDFTDGGWYLNNGTCTNYWTKGMPADRDYPALFVTNDGATAAYNASSASLVTAERLFLMPADDSIHVVFDVQIGGESSFDFLKVFLAPSTVQYPVTTTVNSTSPNYATTGYSEYAFDFTDYLSQTGSSSYPYKLNLTSGNIIHVDMMVHNPAANGQAKLVFLWRNDGSGGTQPGVIISNLQVGDGEICVAPTDLTATAVTDGTSTITWTAGGEETSWNITLTPDEGDEITTTVTTPNYTITGIEPGDSYQVDVSAVCSDELTSDPVTIVVSAPALVDIALREVYTNLSNCVIDNPVARITVMNMMSSPISTFEAYYQVNAAGTIVHETVTLDTPLNLYDTYSYTFHTAPVFTEVTNAIYAWVEVSGESNTENNSNISGLTTLTDVKTLPYVENFNSLLVDLEWPVLDNYQDGNTFAISNNSIQFTGSDAVVADDWIISPCVEFAPFVGYIFSFDYKANSPYYNEQFSAYVGPSVNPEENYLMQTFNFNNAEYVHFDKVGFANDDATNMHIAFHAESGIGTDGFTIDNVSIKKAVVFSVTAGANGSVEVGDVYQENGFYVVGENEAVTLTITPDFAYHVKGIYVNGVLVRGENLSNAAIDYFTFTPENGSYVNIVFTGNMYNVDATVNNYFYTENNNDAPGAVYTPAHEQVAHGGSHTGIITLAQYFSLEYVTVNGIEVTGDLVDLHDGRYSLTLDPVMEDKDIYILTSLDSATITYTVEAGQGTINGVFVVDANTALPATYVVKLPGYSNLLSTITPAPGYHVASIVIDGVEHYNIDVFSFERLLGDHTVDVTFAPNHYTITTTGYGSGTVSEGEEFDYDPDRTYTFTATPSLGYRIGTITRNNEVLTVSNPTETYTETLTNILSDYHYEVMFVQNTYTVTAIAGEHGTVSPNGVTTYFYHQDAEITVTADLGYYISSLTYDGTTYNFTQAQGLTTTVVPFLNIEENHTLSATFAAYTFNVTVNAGAHGDITPGSGSFAYGATPTYTITPAAGYSIADVTVDGESVGAVSTYTFPALTADHTIAATFAALQYTISATAGNGGTITPAGNTTVTHNGTQTYTISANAGHHVSNVFVDGVSVGAVTSYTFNNVTADHIIYAAFESNTYTVTVNQPANGYITPGTTTVQPGATPAFVITPNVGYTVTAITVNGTNVIASATNVNGVYTYIFPAVNANQTLTATMTAKTYTINATAGAGGSITPSGSTTVNYGTNRSYAITPANGYVVDNVVVDGISMGAVTSYVFTNVTANHTINATFRLEDCDVPMFLYISHLETNAVTLHWSHPTATSFDVQYMPLNGNLTSITNVNGNSYELTGLNASTTYLWQVRANCSTNNHSEWSNFSSFTTEAELDITGIEDLVKDQIHVYGEHQNVHILNNNGMNIENVRIFDAYGRLVYSGAVTSAHEVINLNVATGAYIVNVTTDQGVANYKVTLMK